MPKQTREIFVSALMDGDKVVIAQAWLGANVEYSFFTAEEYQRLNPPTLAELRHAYFDKNPDGPWISPEYRQSVLSQRGYGEWTSTFLRDRKEAIERPEKIYFDNKRGLWIAEGGKVSPVELPNDGWTIEYDNPTGFPSRAGSREDAEKIFGNDASYFWSNKSGLMAVRRDSALADYGPFFVGAAYEPASGDSLVGARSCRRSG